MNIKFLEGSLLGDASLRKRQNMSNAYFIVGYSGATEHMDRMLQIKEALGLEATISPSPKEHPDSLWLWTKEDSTLTELYHKWYPKGVKTIPKDLRLSAASLSSFFMDDGSSSWLPSIREPRRVQVSFYAQGFTLEDNDKLVSLMRGMGFRAYLNSGVAKGSIPRIVFKDSESVKVFMNTVRPFLVSSYAYKVKIPNERVKGQWLHAAYRNRGSRFNDRKDKDEL